MADIRMDALYKPSEDIVARLIEGELIIVPLAAGIGDMEDELYTLNDTGRAIWDRLDGRTTLNEVVNALADTFEARPGEVEQDVAGLVAELFRRKIIVEAPNV
jgi:hypothetical protein